MPYIRAVEIQKGQPERPTCTGRRLNR